jgi:hypothetical protein
VPALIDNLGGLELLLVFGAALLVKRDLESAIPRDLSIGDMARIASAEMDKRVKANEGVSSAERTEAPAVPASQERSPGAPPAP